MNNEKFKIIPFGGKKYRFDKIPALQGSNLLRMFTAAGSSNSQEFLAKMPSSQFKEIQEMLLPYIYIMNTIPGKDGGEDKEVPSQIILSSGVLDKEVDNTGILFSLTVIALMFNMSSFFYESVLKEFENIVNDFNA
jgi:hypothetical protein